MSKKQSIRQDIDILLADFDSVRWTIASREMVIRIAHGNYDSARSVLNAFCMQWKRDYATMQSSVSNVFPVRVAAMLESAGYMTVESVSKASEFDLLRIENFGETFVQLVERVVSCIRKGDFPCISEDEFIEIADMDLIPDSDFIQSKASRTVTPKANITASDIVDAMVSDRDSIISELEKKIASHQSELDRLLEIHRTLVRGAVSHKNRPLKIDKKVEDQIVECIKKHPDVTCSEVSHITGLNKTLIGRYANVSSRFAKNGRFLSLTAK